MQSNIHKLYASHFLIGLVFWYGIEKLFMGSIGITAAGIGIIIATDIAFSLVFDIPAGMLADRWSRKGMLLVAVASMILAMLILGTAHSFLVYLFGYMLFGVHVVSTDGTYQALVYDSLHEEVRSKDYSKIIGRAESLFLAAVGLAAIASGFIAHHFGYRATFLVSLVPCFINGLVILSLKQPSYHKLEKPEPIFQQLKAASVSISRIRLLRGLAIIMSLMTVVEVFKSDFGQLYILRYLSTPQVLGIIWAIYAFTFSLGSLIAHRFHTRLNGLIWATVLPLAIMSFVDAKFSIILFMVQSVAASALFNQIETRVQDATPTPVRASVLSVLNTMCSAVSVPASLFFGWFISRYNVFWTLRATTVLATFALIYWIWLNKTEHKAN